MQRIKTDEDPAIYQFTLYVAGENASGQRAHQNLHSICDEYVPDKYSIDVVDLKSSPDTVLNKQVLAVPMVVRKAPQPEVRVIGDLSNRDLAIRVLVSLNNNAPAPTSRSRD